MLLHHRPFSSIPSFFSSFPQKTFPSFVCFSSHPPSPPQPELRETTPVPVVPRKRKRYRKACPGEALGIAEEMRFVAMRLRRSASNADDVEENWNTWEPSMDGFVNYLVNSRLVFDTIERIVDDSSDVSYVYFRQSGLERSPSLSVDLDFLRQQNVFIPNPSTPGVSYANYLSELAETNAPSFLCHFYNIYFVHATGGLGIGRQVCQRLLDGRELEFYKWESDVELLLKDLREKLNKLGEPWSREIKNKCLREAAKSFRYCGQIVRLIIL